MWDYNDCCTLSCKSAYLCLFFTIAPICSRMSPVKDSDDGKLICDLKHSKENMLSASPSLSWYIREECLEIQLWLSNRRHDADNKSRKRDKLLGSAFIDLSPFLISHQRKHRQIRCEYRLTYCGLFYCKNHCL